MTMTAHDHTPSPREFIAGSGGIFRDMHVHDLDLVRWLTGSEVETVYVMASAQVSPEGNAVGVLTSTHCKDSALGKPWYTAISRRHSGQLPSK